MNSRRRRNKKDDYVVLALFTLARHTPWWGNVLVAIGVYLGLTWAASSLNNADGLMVSFYTLLARLAQYGSYLIPALYGMYALVQLIHGATAARRQQAYDVHLASYLKSPQQHCASGDSPRQQAILAATKSAQERVGQLIHGATAARQQQASDLASSLTTTNQGPGPSGDSLRQQAIRAGTKSAQEREADDAVSRVGLESIFGTPSTLLPGDGRNLSETLMEQGDAYLPQATLLTDAERRAYTQLRQLYGESVLICPKVRVVDVITPNTAIHPQRSRTFTSLFRQLSQWHLDFVLVDPATFQILCALELDDSSHQRADRMKRDRILNSAFLSAGVRLERLTFRNAELHATPVTQ
ncbi:DUF2726 domain-containing protein [Halomonas sp. E19]|uniref:DUF2726 domain-containing protein n=1 Tax=Halomonas sp. E19 TaxID=3397247 RepID=UPI0040332E84